MASAHGGALEGIHFRCAGPGTQAGPVSSSSQGAGSADARLQARKEAGMAWEGSAPHAWSSGVLQGFWLGGAGQWDEAAAVSPWWLSQLRPDERLLWAQGLSLAGYSLRFQACVPVVCPTVASGGCCDPGLAGWGTGLSLPAGLSGGPT